MTEKGKGARPGTNDAQPPYLDEAAKARAVSSLTSPGPELTPKTLASLAQVCGPLDESLQRDYAQKRTQKVLVADRIPAPGVTVRSEQKRGAAPATMERRGPKDHESIFFGTPVSVSRVGFDASGTTALFHVQNLQSNPGTSYLVLLVKRDGVWKLSCALMDEMRIY